MKVGTKMAVVKCELKWLLLSLPLLASCNGTSRPEAENKGSQDSAQMQQLNIGRGAPASGKAEEESNPAKFLVDLKAFDEQRARLEKEQREVVAKATRARDRREKAGVDLDAPLLKWGELVQFSTGYAALIATYQSSIVVPTQARVASDRYGDLLVALRDYWGEQEKALRAKQRGKPMGLVDKAPVLEAHRRLNAAISDLCEEAKQKAFKLPPPYLGN